MPSDPDEGDGAGSLDGDGGAAAGEELGLGAADEAVDAAALAAGFAAAGFAFAADLRGLAFRAAGFRPAVFLAAGFRAVVFRAVLLPPAALRGAALRAVGPRAALLVLRAGAFLVVFFAVERLAAVFRAAGLRAVVLRAPVFRAVVFLAAIARLPDRLAPVLDAVRFFPPLVAMVLLRFCCSRSPFHTGACTPNHALHSQASPPAHRVNCFFHYTPFASESVSLSAVGRAQKTAASEAGYAAR